MAINRRSVLKIIGAALFAPIVKLRASIDRESLLRAFCCPWESSRYDLEEPFGVGLLTYASDYRHIIRAEIPGRVEDGTRRIPNVNLVWEEYWHPGEFVPFELPAVDSPLLHLPEHGYGTCPLCDDRMVSFGERYPESVDEVPPGYDPDDNTYRDPSCPLCRGEDFKGPCELLVQGVRMNYSRMKPIAALPGVRVAGNMRRMLTQEGPLVFKADGFEGLAMGIASKGND